MADSGSSVDWQVYWDEFSDLFEFGFGVERTPKNVDHAAIQLFVTLDRDEAEAFYAKLGEALRR